MRRLNFEQIRTFVQVVRSGGIGRAADVLHLTQPAVTARIRGLETQLGAQLFTREARGMRLTKRGELLLRHAERLDALADAIERDVIDPEAIEGLLRIGASETIAQTWLPDFVEAIHRRWPRLTIELDVDVTIALRERLLEGRLDLGLLLGPLSHAGIDNVALPDVPLAWCAAAGSAVERPDLLLAKPIVSFSRVTRPFRELVEALRENLGGAPSPFPSASLSAALRLIERGLCVGAMPAPMVAEGIARGTLVRFDPGFDLPALRFVAAYRVEPPSHAVTSAAGIAREVAIEFSYE
ncbi:LysR family transcriptional regulator [Jannaschia aquimarina]|uniref:YofA_1 protein n=1 Tax=Jannaschia aquimarina TaxID=935700 RepID=A0A0D1EQR2_9RHOB|nr:LysR family transcriptional regulator [Jannaschia aquimarina]KIT17980.1 HTH-type transcriptional regulator YofA [Jannaschia aquimarina]SNT04509.1 transcriptional regulator, LysR family [Jannaschia aquimarina]